MKTIKNVILALVIIFYGICLKAQSGAAGGDKAYSVREYMKVEPGMEQAYLKTEALWKKVHQRRVDEGSILGWSLLRRSFGGTNSPYDYVTITTYRTGKDMDDAIKNMTWDYITKGMTAEELVIANNTDKTRKMVSSQLIMQLERVQPKPNNRYIKQSNYTALPGKARDLEKMNAMLRPVYEEACKAGSITGWRFGYNLYPRTPVGAATHYRMIAAGSMDDILNIDNGNFLEPAFKKVYPDKNYADTRKTLNEMITVGAVELYELIEATKNK